MRERERMEERNAFVLHWKQTQNVYVEDESTEISSGRGWIGVVRRARASSLMVAQRLQSEMVTDGLLNRGRGQAPATE